MSETPTAPPPDVAPAERPAPRKIPARSEKSRGRVLLAEDSEPLREIVRRMLESGGYQVVEARDGQEAVEMFRADPDAVDVVVLDAIMPRLGGLDAYDAIRAIAPRMPVVLTTGYGDEILHGAIPEDAPTVVPKPFETEDLLRVVRAEIASAGRTDR